MTETAEAPALHVPTPVGPTEAKARVGYLEMVRTLTRAGAMSDGLSYGSPKSPLLGLMLDNCAPVFFDFASLDPAVFGILGDAGTGKTFAAELFRLRQSWVQPRNPIAVFESDTEEAFQWPARPRTAKAPRPSVITVGRETARLGRCRGAVGAGVNTGAGWAFKGLMLRRTPTADSGLLTLTKTEAEWLPRARLPKESGYAEGLLYLTWARLPVAIVASTPEYEYLRSRGF